jgi:hypothetical protein
MMTHRERKAGVLTRRSFFILLVGVTIFSIVCIYIDQNIGDWIRAIYKWGSLQ